MALIFEDTLDVMNGSGLYTLQVLKDGSWHDLQTLSGSVNGSIEINNTSNSVKLDTSVLLSGSVYPFRWMDGNGATSNITTLTVVGTMILSVSVSTDADGFPEFKLSIEVIGGSGSYDLHLITPGGEQIMPVTGSMLSRLGATDPQNFSIVAPMPIRGSDYGDTFTFQFADAVSSLTSTHFSITQPPLNTDSSKSLSLSITSSGGNIELSATASNCSGKYRLEIRDNTNNPVNDQDFMDAGNGTLSQTFTLMSLGLMAGQSYKFLLFDTAQVVSNSVTITV